MVKYSAIAVLIKPAILFLLIALTGTFRRLPAQTSDSLIRFSRVDSFAPDARYFTTDLLNQLYTVDLQNDVVKYDASGKALFHFNNNTLGELASIDATDPFNLLLFYPDFQTAITLDRTLNKTGTINFFQLGFAHVTSVATARDNQIWLFDDAAFQLFKINARGEVLAQSGNLSLVLPFAIHPVQILAREDRVFLLDQEQGILIFDLFGQFDKVLDFKGAKNLHPQDGYLFFQQRSDLIAFNPVTGQTRSIPLPFPVSEEDQIRLLKNRLYRLASGKMEVYSFALIPFRP